LRSLILVAALVALSLGAVVMQAGTASAARKADPSCSVSPDPVAVGQTFTVSGLAPAGASISVAVSGSNGSLTTQPAVDTSGTWGFGLYAWYAGDNSVTVSMQMQNGHWKAVANCSFTVS